MVNFIFIIHFVKTWNLHDIFVQGRGSLLSPGQLLLRKDAAGFWQSLARVCIPDPQDDEHPVHPDHAAHPTTPLVKTKCFTFYV